MQMRGCRYKREERMDGREQDEAQKGSRGEVSRSGLFLAGRLCRKRLFLCSVSSLLLTLFSGITLRLFTEHMVFLFPLSFRLSLFLSLKCPLLSC